MHILYIFNNFHKVAQLNEYMYVFLNTFILFERFFLFLISEELILFSHTELKFLGPLKQLGPKTLFISQNQYNQ